MYFSFNLKRLGALGPQLFALAATAIWSGNFIIARGLNDAIPPISLAFWRWAAAVAVFLPFSLKPLIRERHVLNAHLPFLSITAFLGVTLFNTLIYVAADSSTAINISLICLTFPIFMILLSRIFLGETLGAARAAGIVVTLSGVALLISGGDPSRLFGLSFSRGDFWALAASVTFAVYSILLKRIPKDLSVWSFQLSSFILGLLFLFPFFIWERAVTAPPQWSAENLFSIFYLGAFASVAAFVLWNKAVASIGPTKAGMVYYTLPLFTAVLARIFLNETMGAAHALSMCLIVAGIVGANYEFKK
jgi:drug/metabolite transporter (DMT)-like permease